MDQILDFLHKMIQKFPNNGEKAARHWLALYYRYILIHKDGIMGFAIIDVENHCVLE